MLRTFFNGLDRRVSDKTVPTSSYILSFLSFIAIRSAIEPLSTHESFGPSKFFHFFVFFTAFFFSFLLVYRLFNRVDVSYLSRLVLAGFAVVMIPPGLDLVLSLGKGFNIAYLFPEGAKDLLFRYVTFFGWSFDQGASPGIWAEVLIVLLFSFLFCLHNGGKVVRGLLFVLALYTLFFVYSVIPSLLLWAFKVFNYPQPTLDIPTISLILLVLTLVQGAVFFFLYYRRQFRAFVRDIRLLRLVHYLAMPAAGILIAHSRECIVCGDRGPQMMFVALAVVCVYFFSNMLNNIEDRVIDAVSNTDRPLVSGAMQEGPYRKLTLAMLVGALLFALASGFKTFMFVLSFAGASWLYSVRPLRLKRVPFLSKFAISFGSLMLVLAGYDFAGADVRRFPFSFLVIFFVVFGLSLNFIDLKDYEGDKKDGIMTLPVLVGLPTARWVTGVLVVLSYALVPLLLASPILFAVCVPAGVLSFGACMLKRNSDRIIIAVYLLALAAIVTVRVFFRIVN